MMMIAPHVQDCGSTAGGLGFQGGVHCQRDVWSQGTRPHIPDMTSYLARPIAFAALLLAVIACIASLSQVSAQCTHDHSGDHAGHSHDHGHNHEISDWASGGGGEEKDVSSIYSQAVVAMYKSADSYACIPNKNIVIDSAYSYYHVYCLHSSLRLPPLHPT